MVRRKLGSVARRGSVSAFLATLAISTVFLMSPAGYAAQTVTPPQTSLA
jgi:hypothetical protein